MALSIDVYANDGSPIGVIPDDIYGKGVGGAELALMTWAEIMAQRGHQIRIYNDPVAPGTYDDVEYCHKTKFEPRDYRDVFILWRSPNPTVRTANAGMKIHWSTDQYTVGNFGTDIFPFVDKVVCISPFHVDYHKMRYGIENGQIGYLDLGVKMSDYETQVEKIPNRCIFCSIPDRGLDVLYLLWPRIKERVPDASLVITSDYRLWGVPNPNNHGHRLKWLHKEDVIFLGKIPRAQLIKEQLAAVCQPYPCTYDELFCISSAECQVAGAVSVTTTTGALKTTNQTGSIVPGTWTDAQWQKTFIQRVCDAMTLDNDTRKGQQRVAETRFDWNKICERWETLIETGQFE